MITAFLYLSPSTRRFFLPERETDQGKPSGFTLVELLVAMCVSLLLLGGVVSLFGSLGESVNNSKSNSEMLQTMRHAARQLQSDLGNVSLVPDPAQTQTNPQGFFEYVEGPANDHVPYSDSDEPEEVQLPDPIVVDNQDGGFTTESTSKLTMVGSHQGQRSIGGKVHRAYSKSMKGYGQWQKTGLESGTYRVSITWPTNWTSDWTSKHESNIPVTITAGDNTESFTVDQTQVPSDLTDPERTDSLDNPIQWHHLGEIDVTDGEILVQIGPCGQGYLSGKFVFADAIRIECLELTGGSDGNQPEMFLTGDCDDVLHFTTKTDEGAHEVVWFLTPMKGHENKPAADKRYRLHRYALEINPSEQAGTSGVSQGWNEDRSDRQSNSLNSLALRKNRWAHRPESEFTAIPNEQKNNNFTYKKELAIVFRPDDMNKDAAIDHVTSTEWDEVLWPNAGKTVILENVIAFDVQAYDPDVPIYSTPTSDGQPVSLLPTDPGYSAAFDADVNNPDQDLSIGKGAFRDLRTRSLNFTDSQTSFQKNFDSPLILSDATGSTYDSWSGDYVKSGDVGFDNDGNGIVDTAEDLRESPPYAAPLKAVQVEIRMQEPESGKVRSVKVRKFLGKR